ncbi:MAG: hypothetical protein ACE5OS_10875 [Anaerolineae bacterium]
MSKVSEVHLREMELACLSDGEAGEEVAAHLRWCAHCRSTVADYRWLQGEIAAALAVAADAVPVPRPKWWAVRERMFAGRRRQVVGWRVSAFASVVLAVCLILSIPNFLAPAVAAQRLQPEVVMVPAPVTAAVSGECMASMATPTPAIFCEEAEPLPTPALMLPPTPPEPET